MNPFKMRPERTGDLFVDWEKFWVKPYNKNEVNPYTRTRIILMNGTEFENVWFSHQFSRSVGDDELRRKLAYIRKSEQQQQKILTHLKPADESALEHTIGYEQLAVDLTAHLAKRVNDKILSLRSILPCSRTLIICTAMQIILILPQVSMQRSLSEAIRKSHRADRLFHTTGIHMIQYDIR